MEWYLYILDVQDYGNNRKLFKTDKYRFHKHKFWGHKRIYYTGITTDIEKRYQEELKRIDCPFLKDNFPNAKLRLVYVENLHMYNKTEAEKIEKRVKKMLRSAKEALINSSKNILVEIPKVEFGTLRELKLNESQSLIEN